MNERIEAYRSVHPESRATADWTLSGSSSKVRRATCIYCRRVIATCSASWPATKTFYTEIASHVCAAMHHYDLLAAAKV